ncbi:MULTISPECIES: hypothetical protein [Streptomyces]|uniref:hypothetical protein n=1 Tax=Streptomyces TaxID=1883 RepID=UPI00163C56DE|nr:MULTISPECIES: hypothetical protein [Streptomyces]MBC2878000.1 hypothetical protein [Streptomyces sp. TYQ1024]UBI39958.1 hypothetical protein K7I03_28125 [Streptomyces mobaraensis]UKW32538.1 hypothetical protein MCU78_28055 [Streptomyces sp. TYQ1024]
MQRRRFGRSARRAGPADPVEAELDAHPARDDRPLRAAVDDAAMGRWEGPRDLLAATGHDWDRRIFRLQVLARAGVNLRFAETWSRAEPGSPDALAVLAHVQALRSLVAGRDAGRELMEQAWETCLATAEAAPADPSPWVVLLALVRVHAPDRELLGQIWNEATARDPYNREAHHEVLTFLFDRNHGSGGEMFHWALERAQTAPAGLPLAVLPLVALAESYRQRRAESGGAYGLTVHPWNDCPHIDRVLDGWWRHRSPRPHAQFADDANYLAHALGFAGRHAEAHEVFTAIGPYACDAPWSYCGEPRELFLRYRGWAARAAAGRPPRPPRPG